MKLLAVFAHDAEERIAAVAGLAGDVPGAEYALRQALVTDEDATVRAAAAVRLGQLRAGERALGDALYDTHPSVRAAAARALARAGARAALPLLRRLALEEPLWWVRRAAVIAVARLDRANAITLLRAVLDDPFWRVRHAAVRALLALGGAEPTDAAILAASDGSERAEGALRYLARRLGRLGRASDDALPLVAAPAGLVSDHDPAVVAARLERGQPATPAELAFYIGDPHEALRAAAQKRLRALAEGGETRAILAASWWLEEPRIPHATAAVVNLLDAVAGAELLDALLADPDARPGAAAWALGHIAANRRGERAADVTRALGAAAPIVRRAATAATRDLGDLRAMLHDPDEDVRRLAVFGLVQAKDHAPVLALPFSEQPTLVRRLMVRAARATGHRETLRLAGQDDDPETRAQGTLDRAEARASADPWLRIAVLEPNDALEVLQHDIDPSVRRTAFLVAADALAAARLACDDADPWLRVRAAERLVRSRDEADAARVRVLLGDRELAVRAAARSADESWLAARAEELIAEARAAGRPAVEAPAFAAPVAPALAEIAQPRPLGKTGLVVSPLVLSGANAPSVASLFRAMNEGCNAFFWEPRYRTLTTFLRTTAKRRQTPLVIAGTYHATERAIRGDVERTLRRLDRAHLDVFLVFWTRSDARLEDPVHSTLRALKREGLIRAAGFSTHDRALAEAAIGRQDWDVIMVRHSAAHPGAEDGLFARAEERGVGVLAFSATSYGRLLRGVPGGPASPPTAAECYRYSLSQRGVSACVSAPRGGPELIANLEVLREPRLDDARIRELRTHGQIVRADSVDFGLHIRRFPTLPDPLDALLEIENESDEERDLAAHDQLS